MPTAERTDDVDYNSAISTFMSTHFPKKKLEPDAEELLANLLNAVNEELVEEFDEERETGSSDRKYLQASQKAVENYFEGELQDHAAAEAQRQLTLIETGALKFESKSQKSQQAVNEIARKNLATLIKTMFDDNSCGMKLAKGAEEKLSHQLNELLRAIAAKAGEQAGERELTSIEVKKALDSMAKGHLLKTVNSEGCRCLALYKNRLIEFKPRKGRSKSPKAAQQKKKKSKKGKTSPKKTKTSKPKTTKPKRKRTSSEEGEGPSAKKRKTSKGRKTGKAAAKATPAKRKKTSKAKSAKRKQAKRKRQDSEDREEPHKKRVKLQPVFKDGVRDALKIFSKVNINAKKDAYNTTTGILEDICAKLATNAAEKAAGQDELTADHIKDAVNDLLPEELAQHAIVSASGKPICSHGAKKSSK